MQWSKLRSAVRNRICPALRSRLDFHVTSYRCSHDEAEKVWITFDGERLATFSWYQRQWSAFERDSKGRLIVEDGPPAPERSTSCRSVVGGHLPQDFGDAMREYLDLDIGAALESSNPLIRALALVDERCGRRSFAKIRLQPDEDPLVIAFWTLRQNSFRRVRSEGMAHS